MGCTRLFAIMVIVFAAGPASARSRLGAFDDWAAFRDDRPLRCYAIAEARPAKARMNDGRPYADMAIWPGRVAGPQIHFRLRRERRMGTPTLLALGGRKYALSASHRDAWAPDARADAEIVRLMRGGGWMWITAQGIDGRFFTDGYALSGAASAIDAALLGCARRR